MTSGVFALDSPLGACSISGVVVPVMVIVEVMIVVGAAYRHDALNNVPSANLERPR